MRIRSMYWLGLLMVAGMQPAGAANDEPASPDRIAQLAERDRLSAEAESLEQQGKTPEAIEKAKALIELQQALSGADHDDVFDTWSNIGSWAGLAGDWATARAAYESALRIATASHGQDDWRLLDTRRSRERLADLEKLPPADLAALRKAGASTAEIQQLRRQGRFDDALLIAHDALKTRERILGPDHLDTAVSLDNVATLYSAQTKYAAAEPVYQRALAIREKVLGPDHPDTGDSVTQLAILRQEEINYPEAEALFQRAISIYEKARGPEHLSTAISLDNLAVLHQRQGKYAAAEPLFLRALAIREKAFGPEHPDTARVVNNLAHVQRLQDKFAEAEPLFLRAIAIYEKCQGPDHLNTAITCENLAELYRLQGKYAAAEPLFLRAVASVERSLGREHRITARSLNNLAQLYLDQANYAAAEPLLQRAIGINEKALGPDDPEMATILASLAALYYDLGNYAAAEPLLQRALKIQEKALGPNHLKLAYTLNNLAGLYSALGNKTTAEPVLQRSLQIREKALGPEHTATAVGINNLAMLYMEQKNYAAAEPLYQRAIKIHEKVLGPDHPQTAISLNNLASLYNAQNNYAAAEPLFARALEVREKTMGADHPDMATSLNNLALFYEDQGKYAAAAPLLQRALKIWEKSDGPDHPNTAAGLNNLAISEWRRLRPDAARPLAARGLAIQLGHLERTAANQTEQQQLLMIRDVARHLYVWLTVTSGDLASSADAWRYALAWKGLTTTRQLGLRLALKNDPTYAEFARVSGRLGTLALNPPRAPSDPLALAAWNVRAPQLRQEWQEQKAALEREHESLEKDLALKSAAFRQENQRNEVTPEMVQVALRGVPTPTALVDLVEYIYCGRPGEPGGESRLAAFVVRPEGNVVRVELGLAAPIDAQVAAWRDARRPRDMDSAGRELRRLLWNPLQPYLNDFATVLISPDGMLAQLPWSALPGEKPGTYLIEERALAVIPIPQLLPELLRREPSAGPPTSLLLAGNIEYGGDAGVPHDLLVQRSAGGLQRGDGRAVFRPLPEAHAEFTAIEKRYRLSVPGGELLTIAGSQATESAFREQAGRHQWLHVITHGFFSPESSSAGPQTDQQNHGAATTDPAGADRSGGIGADLQVQDHRCVILSLVTAGAAQADGRLKVGDELLAVASANANWTSVAGKTRAEIIALLRGRPGTIVRVKVRPQERPADQTELALTRRTLTGARPTPPKPLTVHPGLLSGLALAGANSPPEAGKDDGILTALEVSALNLSKVDTVVLSACETGLGEVAGGEGLLGLQRSFQVAGAQTVVASLWKVPDHATSLLMQRIYENLWDKKMGRLAALREAQIWMLRDKESRMLISKGNRGLDVGDDEDQLGDSLPPFYWAAFVLSGDWR